MSGTPSAHDHVPEYVAVRIRRPPPANCRVLQGSTPVVAFGDLRRAQVATLGLNPSRIEFEVKGVELEGPLRRFETMRSLGVETLEDAPDALVERVWRRCNDYFHGNPYHWFNRLEEILRAAGASYHEGSACHLDLSQWATDPTWNRLERHERERLVTGDAEFLCEQLRSEPIKLLLLNGRAVVDAFRTVLGGKLDDAGSVTHRTVTARMHAGTFNQIRIVGWSTNLQSSFGVTGLLCSRLAERVAELASVS